MNRQNHAIPLPRSPLPRESYRRAEVAEVLGISLRTLEREISAGRFPAPDRRIGRTPLWAAATVRRYAEGGDAR